MTKTTFSNGMRLSPQTANTFNNPQFVVDEGGEEFDGQYYRLRDASLSNDPTQIKGRFTTFEGELSVVAGVGLAVVYSGGRVALPSGLIASIPVGTITGLPDNTTTFIYLGANGTVQQSSQAPPIRFLMAQVTTSGGSVTQVTDLRERYKIMPTAIAIAAFGSAGYLGDLVVTGTVTLNGLLYYRNVTVESTGIINSTKGNLFIKCSGTFTMNGTINISAPVAGGSGAQGSISYTVDYGENGQGIGGGGRHNAYAALAYAYEAQQGLGSGGAAGGYGLATVASNVAINIGMTASKGGYGGGAFVAEVAGAVIINGSILANGTAAIIGSSTGVNNPNNVYICGDGASGGTGGSVNISSLTSITLTNLAVLSAAAGNSCNSWRDAAVPTFVLQTGPGGSGGGWVILRSPSLVVHPSAILSAAGGLGGSGFVHPGNGRGCCSGAAFGGNGGGLGSPGTAGSVGQIIQQNFAPI